MRKESPYPPRVIYRQHPNLRPTLVQAKLKSNDRPVEVAIRPIPVTALRAMFSKKPTFLKALL